MSRRVRVIFGDSLYNNDHNQDYKIYAGDHSWRCINSDTDAEYVTSDTASGLLNNAQAVRLVLYFCVAKNTV
jgi:hypothetical protein